MGRSLLKTEHQSNTRSSGGILLSEGRVPGKPRRPQRGRDPASGSLLKLPSWGLMFPTLEGHFPSLSEGALRLVRQSAS